MLKSIRAVMILFMLGFLSVSPVFGAYQVGDTVSNFTLPDAYGNTVNFNDFAGMVVVINFWTNT